MLPSGSDARPWYREPWPWLLMGGPVAAVVTGGITLWLAVASDDGLVADDYYKQGLGINRILERDSWARVMGMRADIALNVERTRITVMLYSTKLTHLPPSLRLRFGYATKSGIDQMVTLAAKSGGRYEGSMQPLAPGRWSITLEDAERTWRLNGEWRTRDADIITLEPR